MKRLPVIVGLLILAVAGIVFAQDEEARKHALHSLGGPFIVYRTNIQEELKLSDGQKQQLLEKLPGYLHETIHQKAHEELWAFLKQTLKAEQLKRFQQLELQHEGPAALVGRPEIARELGITDEQRNQFMGVVRDMQKRMEPLIIEARSGGNREDVRLRAVKIYQDQEGKVEAILSDAQKKQWKEMFGEPFDVFNDN